jgi:hypothetical protein
MATKKTAKEAMFGFGGKRHRTRVEDDDDYVPFVISAGAKKSQSSSASILETTLVAAAPPTTTPSQPAEQQSAPVAAASPVAEPPAAPGSASADTTPATNSVEDWTPAQAAAMLLALVRVGRHLEASKRDDMVASVMRGCYVVLTSNKVRAVEAFAGLRFLVEFALDCPDWSFVVFDKIRGVMQFCIDSNDYVTVTAGNHARITSNEAASLALSVYDDPEQFGDYHCVLRLLKHLAETSRVESDAEAVATMQAVQFVFEKNADATYHVARKAVLCHLAGVQVKLVEATPEVSAVAPPVQNNAAHALPLLLMPPPPAPKPLVPPPPLPPKPKA